jgi:hypothetical protein
MNHQHHAASGCNGFDLLANPPRKASETPDDLHLVKVLSFTGKLMPTSEEVLLAWMLDRMEYAQGKPIRKFTRLELSHARIELKPTAVWNDNGELEARADA